MENYHAEFEVIKGAFSHMAGRDYAASRGEYLNSKILARFLVFDFIENRRRTDL